MFSRMDHSLNLSHWQVTALALLGFTAGMVLHLHWHPLRRYFSDAWEFVRLRAGWVVLVAGASLMASVSGVARPTAYTLAQLGDWRELVMPMARDALAHLAQLPHMLVRPWPLACLMPFALAVLTIRVWRWPYRYGERRPSVEQKTALLLVTLTGFGWLALEVAALRGMMLEWVESMRLALRYLFTALCVAGMQVWLVCFVVEWERPRDTEAERDAASALESVFARWQSVACLAIFDLLWLSLRFLGLTAAQGFGGWLGIELLLLTTALPLAVAVVPGNFFQQGAAALRVLLRAALPLLLLGITAWAVLMTALYASAMARTLTGSLAFWHIVAQALDALVLAMLDSWLLLAALLLMLRLGFPRSPTA